MRLTVLSLLTVMLASPSTAQSIEEFKGEWVGQHTCEGKTLTTWGSLADTPSGPLFRMEWASTSGTFAHVPWTAFFYEPTAETSDTLRLDRLGQLTRGMKGLLDKSSTITLTKIDAETIVGKSVECEVSLKKVQPSVPHTYFPESWRGAQSAGTTMLVTDEWGTKLISARQGKGDRHCVWRVVSNGEIISREAAPTETQCSMGKLEFGQTNAKKAAMQVHKSDGSKPVFVEFRGRDGEYDKNYERIALTIEAKREELKEKDQARQEAAEIALDFKSAFSGTGWDIHGVPLGLDAVSTQRASDRAMKVAKRTWSFDNDAPSREEISGLSSGRSDQLKGVNDRITIALTHWHTGQMPYLYQRLVKSSEEQLMPEVDTLLAAFAKKYGQPEIKTYFPGSGNPMWGDGPKDVWLYPVKNGEVGNFSCPDLRSVLAPSSFTFDLNRFSQEQAKIEKTASQWMSDSSCDGVLALMYSVFGTNRDRIRSYQIVARDFRLEAENWINERDTKRAMREDFKNSMPDVEPDL